MTMKNLLKIIAAPDSKSSLKHRFFHFLYTTIGGFVSIALFLLVLSCLWPYAYKQLTKWANQPPLPTIKKCIFTPVKLPDLEDSKSLKQLKKYTVKFDLDTSIGETSYGIAYVEDSRFSINPIDYSGLPASYDPAYVVFDKRNFKRKPPELIAFFTEEQSELEKLEFSGPDCPVKFEMFGGEK